jgi:hypothetical protein
MVSRHGDDGVAEPRDRWDDAVLPSSVKSPARKSGRPREYSARTGRTSVFEWRSDARTTVFAAAGACSGRPAARRLVNPATARS